MSFVHGKDTIVKTEKGLLRGFKYNDVYHFFGIKYADADRFMPPREVEPWEGVKEATSYGYICPSLREQTIGNNLKNPHRFWPTSEHCQYLNVWTKSVDENAKKPVLVWFHGGGFHYGSSLEHKSYDGYSLCDTGDVVVVTLNHRLNALGYLDLSDYGEKYAKSKNVGSLDLIAALQWVNKNIGYFGGDKDNVTLFGQSGGGMKVTSVMNMPASKGLFKRGLVMSGVTGPTMWDYGRDMRECVALTLKKSGITKENFADIETIDSRVLAKNYAEAYRELGMTGPEYFGPTKSEDYLGTPFHNGFTEHAKVAPLVIGSNFSEFSKLPEKYDRNTMSYEEMVEAIEEKYGKEHAPKVIELFEKAYPNNKLIDVLAYDIDMFRNLTCELVKIRCANGCAPTYNYHFNPIFRINDGCTALHSSDIVFMFKNIHMVPSTYMGDGVAEYIQHQMADRLLSYAKTGEPQLEGDIHWDESTADTVNTMIFAKECEVRADFDKELMNYILSIKG
ncbi:MAG: carboxylesterase/lipase family protein [Erysipelotrichaceae bacterium]|nr:carboxylesterase/lipase family protein [Erysipelotrichaceae bacterium]